MDVIQREEYPSLRGRSRLAVYPGLKHSRRVYSRRWERQHWRLALVLEHLAGYAVPRQVDTSGSVSIYNKTYYVGYRYAGKTVYVSMDPLRCEWLFRDAQEPVAPVAVRNLAGIQGERPNAKLRLEWAR